MSETGKTMKPGLMRRLPILVIAVVAVGAAVLFGDRISFETLAQNREALIAFRDQNFGLSILAYFAIYVAVVGFSLPGATIATLAGGFLFGTALGASLTVTAATTGATVLFLAAKYGFGNRLSQKMDASEGMVRRIKQGLEDNQWSMLFLIRLVPAVPFFVANLIPAFMSVPLWRFVVTTFFGIIPGTVVYTSVGAGLGEVFARGETPNLGIIFSPEILGPILGLCALAALPAVLKAVRGKKGV